MNLCYDSTRWQYCTQQSPSSDWEPVEGSEQTDMVSPSPAKDETSCIVFLLSAGSPACFPGDPPAELQ